MAELRIYDKFGVMIGNHNVDCSLSQWISENCPSSTGAKRHPYSATLNKAAWPLERHRDTLISSDLIDLTVEPNGPLSALTIFIVALNVVTAAYSYYQTKKFQDGYQNDISQGRSIYSPGARVNSAIPSGIIREFAGKSQIFPDLICPPRRKYIDHDEFLYLMVSLFRGHGDVRKKHVYIAETPGVNYEGDITIDIFEPGSDVTISEAHENWFASKEVADLRLTTAQSTVFGNWTLDAAAAGNDFTSYLDAVATAFPFAVGERFELTGTSNPGLYEVTAISGVSNEIATVTEVEFTGGADSRLEVLLQAAILGNALSLSRASNVLHTSFNDIGAPSFTLGTGETVTKWRGLNGGVNWEGPFQIVPDGETTQHAEIDVFFPQGLATLDGSNNLDDATVAIVVQWRDKGTTAWNTVPGTSYTDNTYDQRGFTEDIDFGSEIVPELQFRRVTTDSGFINRADIVEIKRIKAKLESKTSYPDVTTVGLKIRGTNALARSAENKINIRGATRKLPTIAELEANSWDLSDSATKTETGYVVTGAEFLAATQMTDIGDSPESTDNELGLDFRADGIKMLIYDNGIIKIYHCNTPFRPDQGVVYQGYYLGAGPQAKSARFASDDGYTYHMVKFPDPSTDYLITNTVMTIPEGSGSAISTGATTSGALAGHVAQAVSFSVNDGGTKIWVADGTGQDVEQYTLSTAHDLSTMTRDNKILDVSSQVGANDLQSVYITDSESRVSVMDATGTIYQYTMSTPGDISTATYSMQNFNTTKNSEAREIYLDQTVLGVSTSASSIGSVCTFALDDLSESRSTRSIARLAGWYLRENMGDDADTAVDWDAMNTLDLLLESRMDYFDGEFVDETTLWEALRVILPTGYAEPVIKEGVFIPVRTATGTDYEHLYTPDVMLDDGLQEDTTHFDEQEPDGIDVEYFSTITNQMEIIECRATGDTGLNPKRIQAVGITDEEKAWRFGMRERNRLRFKPSIYTFTTEMDGFNSNYGDAIGIASDLFTSQGGEVTAYSAPDVTLDFEPSFGAGTHFAAFRNREGQFSGLYTVVAGPSSNQITLSSPTTLDFVPVTDGSMDSTFMTFGTSAEWGKRAIIRRITPQSDNIVQIEAEEYVEEVFADDDSSPP